MKLASIFSKNCPQQCVYMYMYLLDVELLGMYLCTVCRLKKNCW